MTTNLYLIRHGEAYSNVEPIIEGMKCCRGLTPKGQAQVVALAERLTGGEIAADVLYASPVPRAKQTAEAIAPALGLPIIFDTELREVEPGESDGVTYAEARERYKGINAFLADVYEPLAPAGESWAMFLLRTGQVFNRLLIEHEGKTIIVVCHGGVIDSSFFYFLALGPQVRQRNAFYGRNTGITHWRYHTDRVGRREWHMVSHNDYGHLRPLEL